MFSNAVIFCKIITVGSLFVFISIVIERILQATGNVMFPMIFNLIGAVLNIMLCPILILGMFGLPGLGVKGAGMAVVICQFVVMVIALFMLFGFKHHVKIKIRGFRLKARTFADIYAVGVPSIVMMSVTSVMIAAVNAILIVYSATAVAILGIYFRINSFVFMPAFGLNQGAMPIMGFNFGARLKTRLLEAYKFMFTIALGILTFGMILFLVFAPQILYLFDASPDMYALGVPALRIFSLGFMPAAFNIATAGLLQALAHGTMSMITSLTRQLIIVVPLLYILVANFGITIAWTALPISEFLAAALMGAFMWRVYIKDIKNL
jgi:putative MATE family efflux protein